MRIKEHTESFRVILYVPAEYLFNILNNFRVSKAKEIPITIGTAKFLLVVIYGSLRRLSNSSKTIKKPEEIAINLSDHFRTR